MSLKKTLHFRVSYRDKNMLLLAFLRKAMPSFPSLKAVKRVIEQKGCQINGKTETYSTHPLREGDEIVFNASLFANTAAKLEVPILYEDEEYVICNKPAGLVSEDKEFHKKLAKQYCEVTLVHRLDKETSGVIILAKSVEYKEKMVGLFLRQEVKKEYLTIVDGRVLPEEGVIESYLGKLSSTPGKVVFGTQKGKPDGKKVLGKLAVTAWKKCKVGAESSLLLCKPKTGRTHQIRIHLAEMNHAILGDDQYGKKNRCEHKFPRQLLHASQIEFTHPISKKVIRVEALLPQDFVQAKKVLGLE